MTPEGYPDDAELDAIANWPHGRGFHGLMAEVRRLNWEKYGSWRECDVTDEGVEYFREYRLATGGWSGNESLIGALQENFVFWSLCWQMSERGGLYVFRIAIEEEYRD